RQARLELVLARQQTKDLAEEEGVPVRLPVQRLAARRGVDPDAGKRDPLSAVRRRQTIDEHATGGRLAGQPRERVEEGVVAPYLGIAGRGGDEQPRVAAC